MSLYGGTCSPKSSTVHCNEAVGIIFPEVMLLGNNYCITGNVYTIFSLGNHMHVHILYSHLPHISNAVTWLPIYSAVICHPKQCSQICPIYSAANWLICSKATCPLYALRPNIPYKLRWPLCSYMTLIFSAAKCP